MSYPVELTWYRAVVLIAAGLAAGVGIANLVYFNRIRLNGQCSPVSESTATTMVWLNLIVVILAAVAFFWSLFRLIFNGEDHDIVKTNYNLHTHLHADSDVPVFSSSPSAISVIANQGFQV